MPMDYRPLSDVIRERRSVRLFAPEPVEAALVSELVELACAAPAPHHSRPWRFVHVRTPDARERLAEAMSEAWLADLRAEGRSVHEVQRLLAKSREQITAAPVLLLSCLAREEERDWPDEARRRAEADMFMQSLGAALQNILLAAVERGLAGYLKGAPLFCAPAVREALDLSEEWDPAFLVLLGYPPATWVPRPREPLDLGRFLLDR